VEPVSPEAEGATAGAAPELEPAVVRLRGALGETAVAHHRFRGEDTVVVPRERISEALELLRDDPDCAYDFLTDLTAVHYPGREYEFEVVYLLYSFARNRRLRVKTRLGAGEDVPTAVPVWSGANWLERECYDMFGLRFAGHPDLRRILMPEDYDRFPLRKEVPLKG
jgi:NADH-quinone oxidoreductase subunit C